MRARARARHAKPSNLRNVTLTTGLATAVTVPLMAQPASAHTAGSSSSGSSSHASSVLQLGSRGPAVVALQRRLDVRADGDFGPRTRAAVVAFQRRAGLAADGVVGPRTRAALAGKAVANRSSRASAVRAVNTTTRRVTTTRASSKGAAAVALAAQQRGKPYRYGATGPNSFDCSGLVQYVWGRLGVKVPRTSGAQAAFSRRVAKSDAQLGDLVIIYTGGRVTHVGIYAGNHSMWVARRSGTTITKQRIYTSNYSIGRF